MRLIAASPDCRPKMHGYRFAGVLDDIRAENRLEYHPHWVGKSRRRIGHFGQQSRDAAGPDFILDERGLRVRRVVMDQESSSRIVSATTL